MKYLVISDIHSNLEALTAVLAHRTDEQILCLGDIIGYGADPKACIDLIRDIGAPCVLGNHEAVQLDLTELGNFNRLARESALFTQSCLTQDELAWIGSLPTELIYNNIYLSHGSSFEPDHFHYLMPQDVHSPQLILSFTRLEKLDINLAFNGHTHVPGYFTGGEHQVTFTPLKPGTQVQLDKNQRYIINCGSVGQPRNHDSNAQFIIFDDTTWTISLESHPYDIQAAALKMQDAQLPELLWQRLFEGI